MVSEPRPGPSDRPPAPGSPAPVRVESIAPATPSAPSGSSGSVHFLPGSEIIPGYEIIHLLGRGGFGEVWKARGPGGFDLALKLIRLGGRSARVELRSLELMKGVRHPNLLGVSGAWQQDELLILAMELADRTLLDRLDEVRAQGQPGIGAVELIEYMREAAKGIDHLNALGVQHRDIKPQNLLLVGGGVKVADFGLAKLLENSVASNTGSMTPAYAAPEFLQGQTSAFSDQYSLAVSYCQLRGGRLPFEGHMAQILTAHLTAPPNLSMLPEAERPAVARALAKKPEERWPSCRAFVAALPMTLDLPPQPPRAADVVRPVPRKETTPSSGLTAQPVETKAGGTAPAGSIRMACPGCGRKLRLPGAAAGRSARCPVCQTHFTIPEDDQFSRHMTVVAGSASATPSGGLTAVPDRPSSLRPTGTPRLVTNSVGMELVLLPAGTFQMGSLATEEGRDADEGPPHEVEITRPFYLGAYPVTQEQYARVMGVNPSWFAPTGGGSEKVAGLDTARFPVEWVSWDDAEAFCRKLSALPEERQAGRTYRLPTEAEWEYAGRGGGPAGQPFAFGKALSSQQANFDGHFPYGGAAKGPYLERTAAVGSYAPNGFGLYDLHGNVWEWCADWYDSDYYRQGVRQDPRGPEASPEGRRVIRGGCWFSYAKGCRSADRTRSAPGDREDSTGFRVVLVVGRPA